MSMVAGWIDKHQHIMGIYFYKWLISDLKTATGIAATLCHYHMRDTSLFPSASPASIVPGEDTMLTVIIDSSAWRDFPPMRDYEKNLLAEIRQPEPVLHRRAVPAEIFPVSHLIVIGTNHFYGVIPSVVKQVFEWDEITHFERRSDMVKYMAEDNICSPESYFAGLDAAYKNRTEDVFYDYEGICEPETNLLSEKMTKSDIIPSSKERHQWDTYPELEIDRSNPKSGRLKTKSKSAARKGHYHAVASF